MSNNLSNMSKELVSIIIPTFNRAHLIGETLNSVLAQTHQNWECIIVDDGSTDNTIEVINKYVKKDSRFQLHHRPLDRLSGGNAARNYGFELSKGEFINWFDDDDIMINNFLDRKVELFSEEIDLVICSGTYTDQNLKVLQNINLEINTYLFKDYVLWRLQILTPSILFRRTFLNNKELFNLNIARGQETELFSRLFFDISPNNYKIIDIPLFLYRQHGETKSEKNNQYVKTYKKSQSYIALENFKRSIALHDNDLIQYFYKAIVEYFFRALENNHAENANYILKEFIPLLKSKNYIRGVEFAFFGRLFYLIDRGSYRIEKYLKLKKINE
ncbi:glycosyltransferase [Flavobacterium sp. DG2-3]|uniref:glycosyltransferase family 2 protein n=1 Tax=Flavobacterium sp. DG2-3 TaxID=3068317 RepID=UPI00273F950A|nr:glycosyltransferase [Flavobacterium sp. DG2-3]MDP5200687.1 glycosyltransferase [Flavobacterium sp. DG2-3]